LDSARLPADQYLIYKALTRYSYVNKNSLIKKYKINIDKLKKQGYRPDVILEFIPEKKDFEKFDRIRKDKLIVTNEVPNKKTGRPNGIPQGSGMSAMLSNLYLIGFDKMMHDRARKEGFLYRRYCDDILIICDSDKTKQLKDDVIEIIEKDYFLTIQDKKVEIIDFHKNSKGIRRSFNQKKIAEKNILLDENNEKFYYKSLQYLGFEFNGKDVLIRPGSLSRYYKKMKARILKTVSMAYSPNSKIDKILKKQLFEKYSHLGKRNFLKYAYNAASVRYKNSNGEEKDGMNSPAIRKQVKRHFDILVRSLNIKNADRFRWKVSKGKGEKLKPT